jgi:deaminated glutathione amidase
MSNETQRSVAIIPVCSTPDKKRNIALCMQKIEEAATNGHADWVCLPEIFAFAGQQSIDPADQESDESALIKNLSAIAKKLELVIIAGSVHELNEQAPERPYNTCYVFGRDGRVLCKYRKINLFTLRHHSGVVVHDETEFFTAGKDPMIIDIDGFRVGLAICFDLRFSVLFQKYYEGGPLDVVFAPSAFTKSTGRAHWHILNRARAIEFQCYMISPNQVGEHAPGKYSYGHSLVVNPWGEVLFDSEDSLNIGYVTISRDALIKARAQIPMDGARHLDFK